MTLPVRVTAALDSALDNNLPSEVPGAAVAILTPEGEWFGASGVSDVASDTPLLEQWSSTLWKTTMRSLSQISSCMDRQCLLLPCCNLMHQQGASTSQVAIAQRGTTSGTRLH